MANANTSDVAPKRIRVVLADDNYAFRQGLNVLLSFEKDIEVVGVAKNERQTIELALAQKPDAVVMDLSMGHVSGIEVIRTLVKELPNTKVLVLSGHSEQNLIDSALACGASHYLSKADSLHEVVLCLRETVHGVVSRVDEFSRKSDI